MFVYRPFRFSLSLVPRLTEGLFTGYTEQISLHTCFRINVQKTTRQESQGNIFFQMSSEVIDKARKGKDLELLLTGD